MACTVAVPGATAWEAAAATFWTVEGLGSGNNTAGGLGLRRL